MTQPPHNSANSTRLAFTGKISANYEYELEEDPIYLGRFPVVRYTLNLTGVGDITIAVDADIHVGAFGFLTAGTTQLGADRGVWASKMADTPSNIDSKHEPVDASWWAEYDGPGDDLVQSFHDTQDGYLIGGSSKSWFPGGVGTGSAMWSCLSRILFLEMGLMLPGHPVVMG